MNDPAWLVCVLAYGFGVAQTLRLRPTIGLPLKQRAERATAQETR